MECSQKTASNLIFRVGQAAKKLFIKVLQ